MKAESTMLAIQGETTCHKKREWWEQSQTFQFFFLVFCCRSNPKWGPKFSSLFTLSLAGVQLSSLPHNVSQPTNFQTKVVPLLLRGIRGSKYPFSVVLHLHRRFKTTVFFNYRSHSPVTVWPTTSVLAWLTHVSWLSADSQSAFSYYFSFFSSSPEILFITWMYHIMLQNGALVACVAEYWVDRLCWKSSRMNYWVFWNRCCRPVIKKKTFCRED